MANGIVTTGANRIISPNGGSVNRTSGWINGNLQRYIGSSSPGAGSFVNIPGATNSTLVYNISNNAFFQRIAYSGSCSEVSPGSAHANGPINNPPSTTVSNGGNYCAGGSGVTISLAAGYNGAIYTLQWYNGSTWIDQTNPAPITSDGTAVNFNNVAIAGTYRISATIPGLCTAIANGTATVTINPLPAAPSVDSPAAICQGSTTPIIGTTAADISVNWYSASTGGSPLNGSPLATGAFYNVTPATTTTYYSEAVNNATGCISNSRTPVTVTVNPRANITSQASKSICSGSPVAISLTSDAAGTATYTWIAANNASVSGESSGLQNTGAINDVLSHGLNTAQTVTYTVTPTYPTGCTGNPQTVTVTIDPQPAVVNQTLTPICNGSGFTFTPTNGGGNVIPASPVTQYRWCAPSGIGFTNGLAGSGTSISGTPDNTTAGVVTAVYTVTPTTGSCSGSNFTVTVNINPRPVIANETTSVCSGSPFTVSPANVGGNIVPASTS